MIEVVMVPANQSVADLIEQYANGDLDYGQLFEAFAKRGWSTKSLYENVRHIEPKVKP